MKYLAECREPALLSGEFVCQLFAYSRVETSQLWHINTVRELAGMKSNKLLKYTPLCVATLHFFNCFNFILWQCTKTTWLGSGQRNFFGVKCLFWSWETHSYRCADDLVENRFYRQKNIWRCRLHSTMTRRNVDASAVCKNVDYQHFILATVLMYHTFSSVILHPKKGKSGYICSLITTPASYIPLPSFSCDLKWLKSRRTSCPLTNTPHFLWRRPVSLTDETTLFGNTLRLSKVLRHRQWNEPFCNLIK